MIYVIIRVTHSDPNYTCADCARSEDWLYRRRFYPTTWGIDLVPTKDLINDYTKYKEKNMGETIKVTTTGIDPKQSQANKKKTFDNIPISLLIHALEGADNGANKYGPWNWLKLDDGTMSLKTYINALQRHLILFRAGQDNASDSGIHHLKHMIAGLAVVLDAMLFNKVNDDRVKLSISQIEILEKALEVSNE